MAAAPTPPTTVPALLATLLRVTPERPAVTWLDPPTSARVELSRRTLVNWVAKATGLLADELDVARGDRVLLRLPVHWLALVWPLACWAIGAVLLTEDAPQTDRTDLRLELVGDDRAPHGGAPLAVVGLGAMGGPARRELPPGGVDTGALVLGQPDELFVPDPPTPESPALLAPAGWLDQQGVLQQAGHAATDAGLGPGGRLASDLAPSSADALLTLLGPLVLGGSSLLTTTAATGPYAGTLDAERPDARAGSLAQPSAGLGSPP